MAAFRVILLASLEWIQDRQACNPSEIVRVPRDQRAAKDQRRASNERVTQGHFSQLAKLHGLLQDILRQRQDRGSRKSS